MEQMVFVPIAPCVFICRSEPTCEGRDIITLFGELHIFRNVISPASSAARVFQWCQFHNVSFLSVFTCMFPPINILWLYHTYILPFSLVPITDEWILWNDLEKQKQVQGAIFGGSLPFLFHFCFNIALIDILNLLLSLFFPSEMLRDR